MVKFSQYYGYFKHKISFVAHYPVKQIFSLIQEYNKLWIEASI